MKKFSKLQTVLLSAYLAIASFAAQAQEGGLRPAPATPATAAVTPAPVTSGKTVIVMLDITGSFVDHELSGNVAERSIKRAMKEIVASVGNKSLVRVSIIGQSHRDVTGTDEHLLAKEWIVGARYTKEKVASQVRNWLEQTIDDLRTGKIKKQNNTAVVMAFDRASELVRKAGQPCSLVAITDMDETEVGYPLPAPYRSGMLAGCTVHAIGAGVTLKGGTNAERDLRRAWEQYLGAAGVNLSDFYWIPNP